MLDNEIITVALWCLICIGGVIVVSIKERERISHNLTEFFKDWWHVIKTVIIPLAVLLFIAFLISLAI